MNPTKNNKRSTHFYLWLYKFNTLILVQYKNLRKFGHGYVKYLLDYATNPKGQLLTPEEWAIDYANGRFNSAENDFLFPNRPQPKFSVYDEKPPSPKFGSYFNKDSFLLRQS